MRILILLLVLMSPGKALLAQEPWPSRPVTLIVPFGAGGAPDLIARVIAERLAAPLGQAVVVSNRPGSSGLIGGEAAARSRPDGYTLLIGDDALFAINPHVYRHMTFNPAQDFTPIAGLVENLFLLAIHPSLPAQNLQEFIALARRTDPPLAYGSSGNGGQSHLTMERLRQLAGVTLLHVPYKSVGQAVAAAAAGEVSMVFSGVSGAAYVRSGRLRVLASTGPARSKAFPEVPALHEIYPGLVMTNWQALFAPAGTPAPILERLEHEVGKILASDDLVARLTGAGDLQVLSLGSVALARRIRLDSEKYREIVERVGLKLD